MKQRPSQPPTFEQIKAFFRTHLNIYASHPFRHQYLNKQQVIDLVKNWIPNEQNCTLEEFIRQMPPAPVRPVQRFAWTYEQGSDDSDFDDTNTCPNCGFQHSTGSIDFNGYYIYCPICGVDMQAAYIAENFQPQKAPTKWDTRRYKLRRKLQRLLPGAKHHAKERR